ncbi:MAG: FeoA family protein [Propionibacteriaceae bacterium]
MTTENPHQHLADDLRARRIDAAMQPATHDGIALTDLKRGEQATICSYATEPDSAISRRLFDLGFVAGATIELIRKAPLGDPLMVRVAGADMLLRRQEARQIRVARLNTAKENS